MWFSASEPLTPESNKATHPPGQVLPLAIASPDAAESSYDQSGSVLSGGRPGLGDLRRRQAQKAFSLGDELRDHFNPLIAQIRKMEKPVVGAVNGLAAGAG